MKRFVQILSGFIALFLVAVSVWFYITQPPYIRDKELFQMYILIHAVCFALCADSPNRKPTRVTN